MAGDAALTPKVKSFACSGCGAPLTVRGLGQTETIACTSCGSVIDLTDENLQIISKFEAARTIEPLIELGTRATFLGEKLEVIGYLRRKIVVEGVPYEWAEYLLFNPYKGFRWLNEYNGHWTYIRTLIERPKIDYGSPQHMDRRFKHFQTANAQVSYVLGEFFWRVEVGERANVEDYVSPPYMLSRESSDKEIVWSLGQYVEPEVVWQAFRPKSPAPLRVGVAPCQPRPHQALASSIYRYFFWLLAAAFIVQLLAVGAARNQLVFKDAYTYSPRAVEKSFVTDVFDVPGRTSNLVIKTQADVSNDWIYLSLALIDEASGNAYDFGREISYYSGHDSDGSWSEGSRDDSVVLPAVPAGRYYLRIEPEGSGTNSVPYQVQVYRDVPRWTFLFWTVIALGVFPAWMFWRQSRFEIERWSESDHPIITYSSEDDD